MKTIDTSKLKKFAQYARRALIEQVSARLKAVFAEGSAARREQPKAVGELESLIRSSSQGRVIEQVAYTWFNRFCALRYMDVNRYTRIGVLSPAEGQFQPEILADAKAGHIDEEMMPDTQRRQVFALLNGTALSPDPQGEAYRMLVVAACNQWHKTMPFLFEKIQDCTELLMPSDLLSGNSILAYTRETLTPDVCKDVEVIGWLYQFYISERKDQVMARKSAVPTEDIPAVTQLFTPHWIVRYLVENSLGRLWLLNRPGSKLREHMPYYIAESSEASGEGGWAETETDFLKIAKPEDIRLLDPACGSGHMLTYAFDLLVEIYKEEYGDMPGIPEKILRHNLHGLEICPRAAQLATFALVCKAREYSRTAFRNPVQPRVMCLQDERFDEGDIKRFAAAVKAPFLLEETVLKQLHQFSENTDSFGSLIQPVLAADEIVALRGKLASATLPVPDKSETLFFDNTSAKIYRVLDQAEMLSQRYHVVVANPPYMGSANFNPSLKRFSKIHFLAAKKNLFSMFINRNQAFIPPLGLNAMITLQDWMFISSFDVFRENLFQNATALSMLHLGPRAFDSISGEIVQATAFVLKQNGNPNYKGLFHDLVEGRNERDKEKMYLERRNEFYVSANDIRSVTGTPVAYWISEQVREIFRSFGRLNDVVAIRAGMATGDNEKFVRLWTEVSRGSLCTDAPNKESLWSDATLKWIPFNKGGEFRKWFGNNLHVISYDRASYEFLKQSGNQCPSEEFYFRQNLTWSDVTSASFGVRFTPQGSVFSSVGNSIFGNEESLFIVGCFLCSKIADSFLRILNPTLHCNPGEVGALPFDLSRAPLEQLRTWFTTACKISRTDWDNFETSWDFRDHPLLRPELKRATLETSWQNWETQCIAAILRMQTLETENNRLFIAAYGLEGELKPEVPEYQITLARADVQRDMVAFISYAVGCMMGRYSLDKPGLILADAGDTLENYLDKVGRSTEGLTFSPDKDGVIPVLEGDWFADDITSRFRSFLRVTFGEDSYEENLAFVEKALGKDIQKYFLKDFYTDHWKCYKKRPIYWLFSSPKGSFNALIYMHRYRPDTVSVVLNDYLREFRTKLSAKLDHLREVERSTDAGKGEKARALKEIEKLQQMIAELDAYERDTLYPLAAKRIKIDLDDGVKTNYPLFGDALKRIPGLDATED